MNSDYLLLVSFNFSHFPFFLPLSLSFPPPSLSHSLFRPCSFLLFPIEHASHSSLNTHLFSGRIYFSFIDSTFFFLYNSISFFFDLNSPFRIFTTFLSFLALSFPFNPTSYSHYSFFILDFFSSYCPSLFFIDYLNFFFSFIRNSFLIIISLSSFILRFIIYAYSFSVHFCLLFTLSLFAHSLII